MSNRILPSTNFTLRSLDRIVNVWLEVYEERGEDIATFGIIQLILDRLRLSLVNDANGNGFEMSDRVDLRVINMDHFVSNLTANHRENQFDWSEQRTDDQLLAELIVKLVRKSVGLRWIRHIRRFICALLRSNNVSYLVAKTVVCLYTEAVMMQNDANLDRESRDEMKQTHQRLSLTIANDELSFGILAIICETFFDKISTRPQIIQNDAEGCELIIVKFLSSEFVDINIRAMKKIIERGEILVHGRRLLRFCSRQAIVRALTTIIMEIKGIRLQTVALELACCIEKVVRDRTVFQEGVYQGCVLSDNKNIQHLVAELCRVMLRGADTGIADPCDVVIRATMYHQQFRRNYTTCPMRVTRTFFTEFTNWNAVFEAVGIRSHDFKFIDEIFALLKRVIDHIRNTDNPDDSLRLFSHRAIEYAQNLDRQHGLVYSHIIFTLGYADRHLQLIDHEHRRILKVFLSEIITDYFDDFITQFNAISMIKQLLPIQLWQPRFEQCIIELSAFQPEADIDYDTDANVMATFMKLAVFAWCHMIPKDAILLCNRSNAIVMNGQLDLTKNRTFLAYNLIILVESCINVYKDAGQRLPETIHGVSRTRIKEHLLKILEETPKDIDFLCVAVFWCLSKIEIEFKSFSPNTDLTFLVDHLCQKIKLVTIDGTGVNHTRLQYMVFMLDEIKLLLKVGRNFNIHQLVIDLNKILPDYNYDLKLLNFCIKVQKEDVFVNCAIGVMKKLQTKKLKEAFMKRITNIVRQLPNQDVIWTRIMREAVKTFGKRAQESLDENSAKRVKESGQVIFNSTRNNWSTEDTQATNSRFGTKNSTALEPNNNQTTD